MRLFFSQDFLLFLAPLYTKNHIYVSLTFKSIISKVVSLKNLGPALTPTGNKRWGIGQNNPENVEIEIDEFLDSYEDAPKYKNQPMIKFMS